MTPKNETSQVNKRSVSTLKPSAEQTEVENTNVVGLAPPTLQLKVDSKNKNADSKNANPAHNGHAYDKSSASLPVQRKEGSSEKKKSKPFQLKESSSTNTLPEDVQDKMENSFQADFSNVKIHQNSQSANDQNALAYTQGNDVHFAPGQFKPGTQSGQELIGHELSHVVQQRKGRVKPTTEANGMQINDDRALEKEADDQGRMAAQGRSASSNVSQQEEKTNTSQLKSVNGPIQTKVVEIVNYEKLADQIHKAIDGPGTDEEAVYSALSSLKNQKKKIAALKQKYNEKFGTTLLEDIQGDFSGDELDYALSLLQVKKKAKGGKKGKAIDYDSIAEQINTAISGIGTDEEGVYSALSQLGQDSKKIEALKLKYKEKYSTTLIADIQGDFSGHELNYVLELIGSRSNSEKVNVKNKAQARKAQKIIHFIYTEYGIDVNSQAGVDAIKKRYTKVPDSVKNGLKTKAWEYKELVALKKSLAHFGPILGDKRDSSTRSESDQEVTTVSKVDQAIDSNKSTGVLDTTTLGEYFKDSQNFSMFTAGTNSTIDFANNKKQLEGTAVHEIAHGILKYAESDFITAMDYWTDKYTKSGTAGAEAPITNYGGKNGGEDFAEAVMYYFVKPKKLKKDCPKRSEFIKKLVSDWEKKEEE